MWNRRARAEDSAPWNILVTGQEGVAADLLRELKSLGRFRWSQFRNVIVGQVDDPPAFLQDLHTLIDSKPFVGAWLGKALPIDLTFDFEVEHFAEEAKRQLTPLLDRLAGQTFYVRVERRGHKGQLRTHELEQELGAYLVEALTDRGDAPVVRFEDPDVVLSIEIVGDRAGVAFLTRELRQRFSAVRIR